MSAGELDRHLRPWWEAWFARTPAAAQQALRDYKSDRYPLFAIARDTERAFTAEDLARFAALDSAFTVRWPTDTLLWRGFRAWRGLDGEPPDWRLPAEGELGSFDLWTSTSLVEVAAATEAYFGQAEEGDYSVLYEIELPADHPAVYVEVAKPNPTHEAEVLLPRGTRYAVAMVEQFSQLRTTTNGSPFRGWRIRLRVLPWGTP